MSKARWIVLVVALTTGCLFLVAPLPAPAAWFVLALIPLTAGSIAQARVLSRLDSHEVRRVPIYASSACTLWLLAGAAVGVAALSEFTAGMIGLRALPLDVTIAWIVFGLAAALLVLAAGKMLNLKEAPLLLLLLPTNRRERIAFTALSVTAGVTEELVFRGFLIAALGFLTGSIWVAALLAAALFAALHAYQSWTGAIAAGLLGFALSVPFIVSGSILPSMVAHAAIDIIAGLWLIHYVTKTGTGARPEV